jgi:hypothetical protein
MAEQATYDFRGALGIRRRDIQVCHRPAFLRPRADDQNTFVLQGRLNVSGSAQVGIDLKPHKVRFDFRRCQSQPRTRADRIRDPLSMAMIVGESCHMMVQRVQRSGSYDSRLAHTASENFPDTAG